MNALSPITPAPRPRTFASRADAAHYCPDCQDTTTDDACPMCERVFVAGDTLDPYGDVETDAPGYFAAPFTRFDGCGR